MACLENVFSDPERTNWLKACLALDITKTGLHEFVDQEVRIVQTRIIQTAQSQLQLPPTGICTSCCTANVLSCPTKGICKLNRKKCTSVHNTPTRQPRQCPKRICEHIRDGIITEHRFSGPSWKNTSAEQWGTNSWHIAKCYMPPDGYTAVTSVQETDFNGIMSVMLNCRHFDNKMSFSIAPQQPNTTCLLAKARDFCKAVRHTADCKVTDTVLKDMFIVLTALLNDPRSLANDQAAKEAILKLKELEKDNLPINATEVIQLLKCAHELLMRSEQDKKEVSIAIEEMKAYMKSHNEESERRESHWEEIYSRQRKSLRERDKKSRRRLRDFERNATQSIAHEARSAVNELREFTEKFRQELERDAGRYIEKVAQEARIQCANAYRVVLGNTTNNQTVCGHAVNDISLLQHRRNYTASHFCKSPRMPSPTKTVAFGSRLEQTADYSQHNHGNRVSKTWRANSFILISEQFTDESIRMSVALESIGAGIGTVMTRRLTYLKREGIETITENLGGNALECFHFGSQSEGTTTPGLQSDIDMLSANKNSNIMTQLNDWINGKQNLMMFREDNIQYPQFYLLKVFKSDKPEPETRLRDFMCVRKGHDQVLLSSERFKKNIEDICRHFGKEVIKHGASVSWVRNWDIVQAYTVLKPLPEIQHWVDRCRGRPWPPAKLLAAARVAPSFLVPAGHPDSDYRREEWRLTPNLIERMLMFSLNKTLIKCYILLKLFRKSLCAKIVGDSFTSFHCKNVMFYTIERIHPSMLEEHNLMFLFLQCLHTLRLFLRLGRLPHYIIHGVNLFEVRLSRRLQRRLLTYIDYVVKQQLTDVCCIDIDNLGYRMQAKQHVVLCDSIHLFLMFEHLVRLLKATHSYKITELFVLYVTCKNATLKPVALELIKHMFAVRNVMNASASLKINKVGLSENIKRFRYSLNTDIASNRLKLASFLYCCGCLRAAVRVLDHVSLMFQSNIKAVCGCRRVDEVIDHHVFADMISGNRPNVFSDPPFALCVRFCRLEANCAPYILWIEMNRGMTEEEVGQRTYSEKQWMNCAEVDARPFLHYLQYLAYGGLCERDKQLQAFNVLESYICDRINKINLYHTETALNLLGHCYEMEGDYEKAFDYYKKSLRQLNTNNAANLHVRRVMRLISGEQYNRNIIPARY